MVSSKRIGFGLLAGIGTSAIYTLLLFGIAGRIDLPMYWSYLIIIGLASVVGFAVIDPQLMRERTRPGPGGKDYITLYLGKLVLTSHLVVSALDVGRFHFSDAIPVWAQVGGLLILCGGLILTITSMAINKFFSSVVRIQKERGHQLISTGLYAIVRHPGYTGILMLTLGSALALGSWWGCVPAGVFMLMIVRRLLIEDRFLHEEMEGYVPYAKRVRYRLVPGVW